MVSTIRYSANVSSDHHPNQVPGILIIMNPKQPNLPTCSVTSTYLLFHLLSNPSLHLIANTTLGIIMTAIKISPKTLNHSILSTITNSDLSISYSCSFICLKRIPRFFVIWHGKSSVEIILSELIIPFFDRFSRTKSVNKNTQNSEMNSACLCLHSQSANSDGFSKHPYENLPKCKCSYGADDETRTHDLILTKDVRYHLCHISIVSSRTALL